jgi:hypothetical protein
MRQPVDQRDSRRWRSSSQNVRVHGAGPDTDPPGAAAGRRAQRGRQSEWPVTTASVLGLSLEEDPGG